MFVSGCGGGSEAGDGPVPSDLQFPIADRATPPTDMATQCTADAGCSGALSTCCAGACANLHTDVLNCGYCGHACAANQSCCQGACADLTADPANCGSCQMACTYDNASADCAVGQCALGQCQPGHGNCNLDPSDGCETNLLTDINNCGKCGGACAFANASAGCSGTCYLLACDYGFADCDGDPGDGCETRILSDDLNCGTCGSVCQVAPNALVGCQEGACVIVLCDQGYSDCDHQAADGCEVTSRSDPLNCGGCGVNCLHQTTCQSGVCQ